MANTTTRVTLTPNPFRRYESKGETPSATDFDVFPKDLTQDRSIFDVACMQQPDTLQPKTVISVMHTFKKWPVTHMTRKGVKSVVYGPYLKSPLCNFFAWDVELKNVSAETKKGKVWAWYVTRLKSYREVPFNVKEVDFVRNHIIQFLPPQDHASASNSLSNFHDLYTRYFHPEKTSKNRELQKFLKWIFKVEWDLKYENKKTIDKYGNVLCSFLLRARAYLLKFLCIDPNPDSDFNKPSVPYPWYYFSELIYLPFSVLYDLVDMKKNHPLYLMFGVTMMRRMSPKSQFPDLYVPLATREYIEKEVVAIWDTRTNKKPDLLTATVLEYEKKHREFGIDCVFLMEVYDLYYEVFQRAAAVNENSSLSPWIPSPHLKVRTTHSGVNIQNNTVITKHDLSMLLSFAGQTKMAQNIGLYLDLMCDHLQIVMRSEATEDRAESFMLFMSASVFKMGAVGMDLVFDRRDRGFMPSIKETAKDSLDKTRLTDEQKQCIYSAVSNPITTIIGPAGTGKSHVISYMINELFNAEEVAVITLTHAAGQRIRNECSGNYTFMTVRKALCEFRRVLQNSTDALSRNQYLRSGSTAYDKAIAPPMKLHSLMNNAKTVDLAKRIAPMFHGGERLYTPKCKDTETAMRVLIFDESSMNNMFDMVQVLYCMIQQHPITRVIFVGDPNQLPPIGAGQPFQSLLNLKDSHILPDMSGMFHELLENFRTEGESSSIVMNSFVLLKYKKPPFEEDQAFQVVTQPLQDMTAVESLIELMKHCKTYSLKQFQIMAHRCEHVNLLNRAAHLLMKYSVTKNVQTYPMLMHSVTAFQTWVHETHKTRDHANFDEAIRYVNVLFVPGLRYIMTFNDREMNLYNNMFFEVLGFYDTHRPVAEKLCQGVFQKSLDIETNSAKQRVINTHIDNPPLPNKVPGYQLSHLSKVRAEFVSWSNKPSASLDECPLVRVMKCRLTNDNREKEVQERDVFYVPIGLSDLASKLTPTPGYASTVHKMQGCGVSKVVIYTALPKPILKVPNKTDGFIGPANLYTAVTRAMDQCILVTTEEPTEKNKKSLYGLDVVLRKKEEPRVSRLTFSIEQLLSNRYPESLDAFCLVNLQENAEFHLNHLCFTQTSKTKRSEDQPERASKRRRLQSDSSASAEPQILSPSSSPDIDEAMNEIFDRMETEQPPTSSAEDADWDAACCQALDEMEASLSESAVL